MGIGASPEQVPEIPEMKIDHGPEAIVFHAGNKDILKLAINGDIYVNGKLAENDREVVEGLREFLTKYEDHAGK